MKSERGGFSLLEIVLAMALLAIGALVTLTVLMSTARNNETGKVLAIANKSCQDMTEVLMSMPYADLANLVAWSQSSGRPLTFAVNAAGFPKQSDGTSVRGTYSLVDISDRYGFAANSNKIWEITVRIDHQNIHSAIVTRRKDPEYK
jgi:prepilin-type N-terminal cleavage/methylation domain-containing protein